MDSLQTKIERYISEKEKTLNRREREFKELSSSIHKDIQRANSQIDRKVEELSKWESSIGRREEQLSSKIKREEDAVRRRLDRIQRERDIAEESVREELLKFRVHCGVNEDLADEYIKALFLADEKIARCFVERPRPNWNAAETIRAYKKELRDLRKRVKDLEYILSEQWDVEELEDDSDKEKFEDAPDDYDAAHFFLSDADYSSMSDGERNQLALDRYLSANHGKRWVGKMYERYIGYLWEIEGYDVEYRGIELGLKDGGIDLICKKRGEIVIIQCKCWSLDKTIYEKHICQLYGASRYYGAEISKKFTDTLFGKDTFDFSAIRMVFASTTELDSQALLVADALGVEVQYKPFRKDYPMIKCNISKYRFGERIYHLPFDQKYDDVKITKEDGEMYVKTVKEAEIAGFRRAYRWHGQNNRGE